MSPPSSSIDRILNIGVIGARGVGKTTLIHCLLSGDRSIRLHRYDDDEYPYEEVYRTEPFEIKRKRMVIRIFDSPSPTILKHPCGAILVAKTSDAKSFQLIRETMPAGPCDARFSTAQP
ncbi:hypothetical protein QR680_016095 [Steinernema hermaphroditum]|uniref:Uncharacterized protein n=1 Tax=Steinernema hermaphroditum TaxID=289476 RepID=A0AA39HAZ4_9BILA|nr:hypothetical protein QR680_016095 [Steinernema hermaphroditum]